MEVQLPLPEEKKYNPPAGCLTKSAGDIEVEPRSICILRFSSIGDLVHTLPVADLLREKFPNSRITWIAEKSMAPLLRHHPAIDQLLLLDTKRWKKRILSLSTWKEILSFFQYLRGQRFDVALDFHGVFRSALLARFSGAARRIGMSRRDRRERWSSFLLNEFSIQTAGKMHILEKNLALLETLNISSANQPMNFHIYPDEESVSYVEEELRKLDLDRFIVVNPGGGWVTKMWDPNKFARLIDGIYNELHIPALILWGPGEKYLADKILRKCISPAMVAFSTNLSDLIALTLKARLMVSGDTGPLHLASAMGIPVVGIYGPTDPDRNGPWNPHDSACSIHYQCSPCNLKVCPIGIQCLRKLEVEPVLDAVKKTFFLSDSLTQNQ